MLELQLSAVSGKKDSLVKLVTCDYVQRLRALMLLTFGGSCRFVLEDGSLCGSLENLEFAHLEETGISGNGRGSRERIYDVIKHPECYILFCRDHHRLFDAENRSKDD